MLDIRHFVLDGSRQWIVGRNATSRANILLLDYQCLERPGSNGSHVRVPLYESNNHIYRPFDLFSSINPRRHDRSPLSPQPAHHLTDVPQTPLDMLSAVAA